MLGNFVVVEEAEGLQISKLQEELDRHALVEMGDFNDRLP